MIYVLYTLFVLSCVVLILSVLLQPGKADAGALFTSSVSSAAFGPRGTQTLLAKISIGAAAVFMLTALLITMGVGGYRSVVGSDDAATAPQSTPAAPAAPAAEEPSAVTPGDPDNALTGETAPGAAANAAPGANANVAGASNAAGGANAAGESNRSGASNAAASGAANTR